MDHEGKVGVVLGLIGGDLWTTWPVLGLGCVDRILGRLAGGVVWEDLGLTGLFLVLTLGVFWRFSRVD